MTEIHIIAAMTKNRVIGKNNTMPWHLPADLAHFKTTTLNYTVIMGRNTYFSIGKALPNRRNIIITGQNFTADSCEIFHSLEEAFSTLKDEKKIFIIGGGKIYSQTIDRADFLHITWIDTELDGDTFFPEIKPEIWQEKSRKMYEKDAKNKFNLDFVLYERG
ncbi:MAG: dihydrofolate reductase [Cardiobacteriaceae bacterium]|nr:dihydrofolate reductase [Cardiobacteriaceae bacterium]